MEVDPGSVPSENLGYVKFKNCLKQLKDLQQQHDLLESEYQDKLSITEADYMRSIEPIGSERNNLVRRISGFWLTVMFYEKELGEKKITEHDERALDFLTDIKWSALNGRHNGWKLEFFFDSDNNPYFNNPVLAKCIYFSMVRGRRCIEKITGTEINWRPGRCLVQKTVRKLNKRVLVKTDSFFGFFMGDQFINNVEECDYLVEFCEYIMRRLIPHAQAIFINALLNDEQNLKIYNFLRLDGESKRFLHQKKLQQLELQIAGFESKMFQQMREVEDLYRESVKTLHERRSELVDEFLVAQMSPVGGEEKKEKFWLNAMRGEETLGMMISDQDANALKYLKNIKFSKSVDLSGVADNYTWTFEFFFNPNPYFNNVVLTKELSITYLEGLYDPWNSKGTGIEWLPGGFLLDDPEQVATVESFFNLFNGSTDEGYSMEDLRRDFKICKLIANRIICHAASFYLESVPTVLKTT